MLKNDGIICIIMGTYNPDRDRLLQAISSVIVQTFTEWELILYDDGSAEKYRKDIEEAAKLDSRIVLIRETENKGLAYALNQCLKVAQGKYVARMDDDDICDAKRLENEYQFLEQHPEYHWVGTNSILFDEKGIWGREICPEIPQKKDFLTHSPYIHPSVMFRTEVLLREGGYLVSANTMRSEDYELFMRLHALGYCGYNMQEPMLYYRENKDSYAKRKYRFCIQEMKVRYEGFIKLKILSLSTFPYVLKPLIVGLIPTGIIRNIKRKIKKEYYV